MKKAFITGIGGQDGSYLAEYLLDLGYKVYGIVRRNSTPEHQQSRLDLVRTNPNLHVSYGDLNDTSGIERLLREIQPDEVYNIAAQSHVRISYEIPQFTAVTNAVGVVNMLEAVRNNCPNAKFYQASSSEMFGSSVDEDGYQRETTKMTPVSPYGCAKVFGYNIVRNYRNAYKLHASNGILFNHESPYRGRDFVTQKVVKGVVDIQNATTNYISVGNLDAKRDWGHAKDYVEGMYLMVQQPKPDDYVLATGKLHSIRQMIEKCFDYFDNKITWDGDGLDEVGVDKYGDVVIRVDPKYYRPAEVDLLCGDATKAKDVLGWEPKYTFDDMLEEMLDSALKFSD